MTKVCDTPDAPASPKSAMWKHFGFPLCQEGRKGYRQTQNNMQTLLDHNSCSPYGTFFAHLFTISHHGVDTEVLSYNEILDIITSVIFSFSVSVIFLVFARHRLFS